MTAQPVRAEHGAKAVKDAVAFMMGGSSDFDVIDRRRDGGERAGQSTEKNSGGCDATLYFVT
jgi:hypothetical protein